MQKEFINLNKRKIVGISVRTNNENEESLKKAQIEKLWQRFFNENIKDKIKGKLSKHIYCVYHNYESDHMGDYDCFIGCEVDANEKQNNNLKEIVIQKGNYQKLTTEKGIMPDIIIKKWLQIWQMSEKDFGGKRAFKTDFEVYDERALDSQNAEVDIYIGITN